MSKESCPFSDINDDYFTAMLSQDSFTLLSSRSRFKLAHDTLRGEQVYTTVFKY